VLHAPAASVTAFDAQLQELISDMFETMRAAPGVGLAAPQIGVPLQLFVYEWHDGETQFSGVAINPSLALDPLPNRAPDEEEEIEGCLSVPGERMPLVRAERVVLSALDQSGEPYEIEAAGWLARIFQHEYDHLQGTLYADRLLPQYRDELDLAIKAEGWGVPGKSWLPGTDDLES
jgi:peptide deformylase